VVTQFTKAIGEQKPFELLVQLRNSPPPSASSGTSGVLPVTGGPWDGSRPLLLQLRCANLENMDSYMPLVGIPSAVPQASDKREIPTYYFATVQPLAQQVSRQLPVGLFIWLSVCLPACLPVFACYPSVSSLHV
jgi:hypothetical protein